MHYLRTNHAWYVHPLHKQDLQGWTLSPAQQATVNKRSNNLGGEQNWIQREMNLMTKTFKLKAVDFVRISKGAMSYLFGGVFDGPSTEAHKQAFNSFNESLRLLLTTHFNADGKPLTTRIKQLAANLMEKVAETLSLLEMCSPLILFNRLIHELLHVPMAMVKWNSCRNFWSFPSERYVHSTLYSQHQHNTLQCLYNNALFLYSALLLHYHPHNLYSLCINALYAILMHYIRIMYMICV